MNQDKQKQKLAKEWFDSANSDFLFAKIGLKEKPVFPQVAFISQQITEKFLKGFLILNDIEPPRIHELPKLLNECVRINPQLEKLRDACELLSGFYIETRYPPNMLEYTKTEIADAFTKAKFVKETIEAVIK